MSRKERMHDLIKLLSKDLFERQEIIAVTLLVCLTKQSIFYLGPPGTAKSMIARRISSAFLNNNHFEYLMQRFSTPEEIFGPISITELKKDNFKRKTDKFLPSAEFAFLDEIWKSSPAILNTLLTIINERIFRNGIEEEKVPLRSLIAASNETPPSGQGLEALYDRFVARLYIGPITDKNNFESLIESYNIDTYISVPNNLKIANKEWDIWLSEIEKVQISKETKSIIHTIRYKLDEKKEELEVYVSDRRWQKIARILKAAAYFSDRKETNIVDTLVLRHCLWTNEDNREVVMEIVEESVKENGFVFDEYNLAQLDREKEQLEKEISQELYYTENIYKTKNLNNEEYFYIKRNNPNYSTRYSFYIPARKLKSRKEFYPIDKSGNKNKDIKCNFEGTGTCKIKINDGWSNFREVDPYTPEILYHKGEKKEDVNKRLVNGLNDASKEFIATFEDMIKEVEEHKKKIKEDIDTPFVPEDIRSIAIDAINKLLEDLNLRKKDSERLKNMSK